MEARADGSARSCACEGGISGPQLRAVQGARLEPTFMFSLDRAGRPEDVARAAVARRRPGAGPAGAKADAAATRPAGAGCGAIERAGGRACIARHRGQGCGAPRISPARRAEARLSLPRGGRASGTRARLFRPGRRSVAARAASAGAAGSTQARAGPAPAGPRPRRAQRRHTQHGRPGGVARTGDDEQAAVHCRW